MRCRLAMIVVFASVACAPAQVVINEFQYDDSGTDNLEFVELYNAGASPVDISGWTVSNSDTAGISVGSPVTIPPMTTLMPGQFYVIGDTLVPNVNLVQASGWMENDNESIILADAVAVVIDAVAYETNKGAVPAVEGNGIWGNFTSIEGTGGQSWSRAQDGLDTDNNGSDFVLLRWTPGATNTPAGGYPFCDDFELRLPETAVAGWAGAFAVPVVVDPTQATGSVVNTVPASPDGGNAMVTWDPSGGGNMVFLDSAPQVDMTFEAWVYFWAGETVNEFHSWAVGVRGTTGSFYNTPELAPNGNGNTGICWRYYSEGPSGPVGSGAGTLRLVDEADGFPGNEVVLGTVTIVPGVNDGWQRLRLSVQGSQVSANFGGDFGNPAGGMTFSGSTSTTQLGTAYCGFREGVPGVATAYPLMLDRVEISTPTSNPCVQLYQINQPGSSLILDNVEGGVFSKAVSTQCFNATGQISFASTAVGLPWDAVIMFQGLVPVGGGALFTPGGQIANVNLAAPVALPVWLNGGVVPNLATSVFPLPSFSATYSTGASPGVASIQMINIDPANPEGVSLSQGCELTILPSGTVVGPNTGDDVSIAVGLAGASPLCGPAITMFGTSYTQMFVVSNGRVMFGGGDVDFSPTVAEALVDNPFVGAWADLSPQLSGTITTSLTLGGNIRVDYAGVPYFGSASTVTFGIEWDTGSGSVTLDGLTGIQASSATMFLGICGGTAVGATDPGQTSFAPIGNSGIVPNATDALYGFGSAGSIATGINGITFFPNGFGNFDWQSF